MIAAHGLTLANASVARPPQMTLDLTLGAIVALGVFVYLLAVLARPERF